MRATNIIIVLFFFAISCSNENAKPRSCDGTLDIMLESSANLTTCATNDGTITVSASGGTEPYVFSINGGGEQSSPTFNGLSAGTYSITVIDANDCEAILENIALSAPGSTLDATVNITPDTDCFTNNGAISVSGSGGNTTAPYQFALNSGSFSTNNSFSNLAPDTYSVKIKDADGCIVSEPAEVTQGDTGISFSGTISTIIETKCATNTNCHASGALGGKPAFTNYTSIRDNAAAIKTRTANGTMPPASGGSLSATEKQQIACWVDAGAPNN